MNQASIRQERDFIYESFLQSIFTEYVDDIVTYVEEDKHKRVIELGRTKSHKQKKRAKEGLKLLPIEQQEQFVIGCYDELRIQLLRQLLRMIGDVEDYRKAENFLTEVVTDEQTKFKTWLKEQRND